MNYKLPCFTALLAVCFTGSVYAQGTAVQTASEQYSGQDSRQILHDARDAMSRYPSVSAKIHQQINLFGHHPIGTGAYLHQGQGDQRRIRLELKIQVASQVSSLLQIVDGRYLWIDQSMPSGQNVRRVNLESLHEAVDSRHSVYSSYGNPAVTNTLAVGGLDKILAGLQENFDFRARPGRLSNLAVYELTGTWNSAALATILPKHQKRLAAGKSLADDQFPEYMPHSVVLQLGRDDLFPYGIDYRRHDGTNEKGQGGVVYSIVRIQFYEVRIGGTMDSRLFVYSPGNASVSDETGLWISRFEKRHSSKENGSSQPQTATRDGQRR